MPQITNTFCDYCGKQEIQTRWDNGFGSITFNISLAALETYHEKKFVCYECAAKIRKAFFEVVEEITKK